MPKTQALLPDGTWFPNFILTTPVCCPSRATLLTGRYAHNHGVYDNTAEGPPGGWLAFRPHEDRTLAVALDHAGYHTALVGKYLNGYLRANGTPPGWDTWLADNGQPAYLNLKDPPVYLIDRRAKRAADIAASTRDGPLFLWYAEAAPHDFEGEPPPVAERHRDAFPEVTDAYERARLQSLLSVDDGVATIAAALGPERWDEACVAVLSDNGFMLGEHGMAGGKGVPYDESVRVPMLLRCPDISPGEDSRLAASIDLAPTLARAGGAELPWSIDGRALQDAWDRKRILIEGSIILVRGWGGRSAAPWWAGVRTIDETYVAYLHETAVLWDRRLDAEETSHLTAASAASWAAQLAALRDCMGAACREADSAR
jgi:arylsulfatase A-like enzyme